MASDYLEHLKKILAITIKEQASDLLISVGHPPVIRITGQLVPLLKEKVITHLTYYIVLLLIFALGIWACIVAYPNILSQVIIISATILAYVLWGVSHHKRNHQLSTKIMVEYILIGILGLSMIFFIFMGGKGI